MPFFIPETTASFPSWLTLSRWKYARYVSLHTLSAVVRYLGSFQPPWLAAFTRIGRVTACQWWITRKYFQISCLAPSAVLNRDASLVATFMNISSDDGYAPVIMIKREPLHHLPEVQRRNGAHLTSVCFFYETPERKGTGKWGELDPFPIDCLVNDPVARARATARLPAAAWTALDRALDQVRDLRTPGLYPVTLTDELTAAAFERPSSTDVRAAPLEGAHPDGADYAPEFKGWIARDCSLFTLWCQVTVEDNTAEFFYAPLVLLLIAGGLAWGGVLPFPADMFVIPILIALSALLVRGSWNWRLLRYASPVLACVGARQGKFRKWTEHHVHYLHQGEARTVKHTFLRNEVEVGDALLILVDRRKPAKIRVARRARDKDSIID